MKHYPGGVQKPYPRVRVIDGNWMSEFELYDSQHYHVSEYARMSEKFVEVLLMKDKGIRELDWSTEHSQCACVRGETELPKTASSASTEIPEASTDAPTGTKPVENDLQGDDEKNEETETQPAEEKPSQENEPAAKRRKGSKEGIVKETDQRAEYLIENVRSCFSNLRNLHLKGMEYCVPPLSAFNAELHVELRLAAIDERAESQNLGFTFWNCNACKALGVGEKAQCMNCVF